MFKAIAAGLVIAAATIVGAEATSVHAASMPAQHVQPYRSVDMHWSPTTAPAPTSPQPGAAGVYLGNN
jgi:hypothetical protein